VDSRYPAPFCARHRLTQIVQGKTGSFQMCIASPNALRTASASTSRQTSQLYRRFGKRANGGGQATAPGRSRDRSTRGGCPPTRHRGPRIAAHGGYRICGAPRHARSARAWRRRWGSSGSFGVCWGVESAAQWGESAQRLRELLHRLDEQPALRGGHPLGQEALRLNAGELQ
jgi:hypothetical protein